MFGKQPFFLLLLLATSLWSILCVGAPTQVLYVYRGDSRTPAEIQAAGGFLPKGQKQFGAVSPDISLYNHVLGAADGTSRDDDGYVSTSTAVSVAEAFVSTRPTGYVYKIHVAANMIDCIGTLGKHYVYDDEMEYAAIGGVKFEQIVSWKPWKSGKFGKEQANKKFDKKRFGAAVAGGVQLQLAGFPASHRAWKEDPWKSVQTCKPAIARKSLPKLTSPLKKTPAKPAPIKPAPAKPAPIKPAPAKPAPIKPAPAKQAPVKQTPVKQAPAKQTPGTQPPSKSLPNVAAPVQSLPASPVQDYPVEDALVEDALVEDAPVEDAPVEDAPALNTPAQNPPAQQLQPGACNAPKSAFDIAKAYMASIQV